MKAAHFFVCNFNFKSSYMIKKLIAGLLLGIFAVGVIQADEPRARRKRPGSMTHTEAEVKNARKVTRLQGRYIKDNSTFDGDVYMVGDAGGIKIGKARIVLKNGGYTLSYDAGSFTMRDASTRDERMSKGITEYEYEHSWKDEKLGKDFAHAGKYEIAEQFGKINLILYDGNSTDVFVRIPLTSANDKSFEFTDEDFLIRFASAN